jgi:uncharacterized protein YgbK (DUF1537 family)
LDRAAAATGEVRSVMEQPRLGIIADDLTGAADTAAAIARPGAPVRAWLGSRPLGPVASAVAVTTDSRHRPADQAVEATRASAEALREAGATLLYKKVDSNLRGNVAAELGAVMEVAGGPVLFAPAFPQRGRTTVGGVQSVEGVPVAETEMGRDPQAPARCSDVVRLLVDGWRTEVRPTVQLCPLEVVRAGAEAIRARLREGEVLVCDAETDADLEAAAEAALAHPEVRLVGGCAGLAAALARRLYGERPRATWPEGWRGPGGAEWQYGGRGRRGGADLTPRPPPQEWGGGACTRHAWAKPLGSDKTVSGHSHSLRSHSRGPCLAVLASASATLTAQVEHAASRGLAAIPFSCANVAEGDEVLPELGEAIARTVAALAEGRDALVYSVGTAGSRLVPARHDPARWVELVVEQLAHLALVSVRQGRPRALLVGGGSTAQGVLGALGATALDIDDEPLPGLAAGLVVGGELDQRPVALKPGAAGGPEAVTALMWYLGKRA